MQRTQRAIVSAMISSSALLSLGTIEQEKGSGRLVEAMISSGPDEPRNDVYLMVLPVYLYSE